MYRQMGVLAACVECCRPDYHRPCATASDTDGASCRSWALPGVHTVGTCTSLCLDVVLLFRRMSKSSKLWLSSQLHVNLTSLPSFQSQLTSLASWHDDLRLPGRPLVSSLSRQRLNPRSAASSQTSFCNLSKGSPISVAAKSSRFVHLPLCPYSCITKSSAPSLQSKHTPHSHLQTLTKYPAHYTVHSYTYDFARPPRTQRQPEVSQHQGRL